MNKGQLYSKFNLLNGNHSFKECVPGAYVEYRARKRHGGKVFFFNFELAKEMGLIPQDHPHRMNAGLAESILDAFALVIINEYDIQHKIKFPEEDIKPGTYMATRYLQLQHPNKQGKTSGDGRGIWNGEIKHRGVTWDVSSSGTGATCLSPAAAIEGKFFKTGDPRVCYGNGYGSLDDGLSTALMSEVFARNGIETERVLAVIEFENGSSINVRAGKSLLRPSHFFSPLKQGNLERLQQVADYFIERQTSNGDWPSIRDKKRRYEYLAHYASQVFSKSAARFESDYIFCWMDWDGDNILCNGGIIDYGSVRQFGLYHHEYRYDDVERWSTRIPEQKLKARYIVQCFAQISEFLITGKKKNISHFRKHPAVRHFDKAFAEHINRNLLFKVGLSDEQAEYLQKNHLQLVSKFKKHFSYFEKAVSSKGVYTTSDGLTADAIFSMRDALRALPYQFAEGLRAVSAQDFISIIKSKFAKKRDLELTGSRLKRIEWLQSSYLEIVGRMAEKFRGGSLKRALVDIGMRASVRNPANRITGDGVLWVTDKILREKRRYRPEDIYHIVTGVVASQLIDRSQLPASEPPKRLQKVVQKNIEILFEYRESI